jgi:Leucine-rich repeat (LRR) protein
LVLKRAISLIILIFPLLLFSQEITINADTFDSYYKALKHPARVKHLSINCNFNDCKEVFQQIENFKNLEKLEVRNVNDKTLNINFEEFSRLECLSIVNCQNLNSARFFRKISNCKSLEKLNLENANITRISPWIAKNENLIVLKITNNEDLNLEQTIKHIKKVKSLKELYLPVNMISDLPKGIGDLSHLELLDLSSNTINDLPDDVAQLDSLKIIFLEDNFFINPLNSLEKLSGLNLRYISFNQEISDEEKLRLEELFPNTEIVEYKEEVLNQDSELIIEPDTTISAKDTQNIVYNKFKVHNLPFRAFSPAYLHYPEIFDNPLFEYSFDTTLFEERYRDLSYENTRRILDGVFYRNLKLEFIRSREKGEIWFKIADNRNRRYINYNNPELKAFKSYVWVYNGDLTKRKFKKQYCKRKYYLDARVYFIESENRFIVELKHPDSFIKINAYLRKYYVDAPLEKVQGSYLQINKRYLKLLQTRKNLFQRTLKKNKASYDENFHKNYNRAWKNFKNQYFSETEKKMSRKEWLEYYDRVLANEKEALKNAIPHPETFKRALKLSAFKDQLNLTDLLNTPGYKILPSLFKDEEDNMLVVASIILINNTRNTFSTFDGSLGLEAINLYINQNDSYSIVAILRNGDMGVLSSEKFSEIDIKSISEHTFTLVRVSSKLGTMKQVFDMISL